MNITIKEISKRRDLKKFVKFPNNLYKENKYYVPQLVSADLDALDHRKNHAFEYCEAKYWMAYDEHGKIIGRVAGIINHSYNNKTQEKYVRFGWLDFIDDKRVSKALLDKVESWGVEKGMKIMNGPLGFLEFDASGILVEGYDEYPTAYGKYNYPYYDEHLTSLGYSKDTDFVEYRVTLPEIIPDTIPRAAKMIAMKESLHTVPLRKKSDLYPYIDQVFALMNKAYSVLHGYSELTQGQVEDLKRQFLPNLNIKFVALVVDENEKLVGFCIWNPSLSLALQKAKGKMFPFGFIHLLRAMKKNDTLDTLLIAIDDEYKRKGVNAIMFNYMIEGLKKHNIKYLETTRELEGNHSVRNLCNKFESRLHKRARTYIKSITK